MDLIHLLPDSVANQIAAGEVIQRPASVVKELVENAVDAGAKHIDVIAIDAGRTSLQVVDDGKGMSETDARLAFERHATSKIQQATDLFTLTTMGFRGEALPSIASVAQVELTTRTADSDLGTHLVLEGSSVVSQEPTACPIGSNFLIKNLFFNVPARRKFLKSNQTELANISAELERVMLVNPDIAFTFTHNGTPILSLTPSSLKQRIAGVFGNRLADQLLPVEVETPMVSICGFVGKPESSRKRGAQQFFFVNNRYMRHPYFHRAVQEAFMRLIPADEQVPYFIYFDVPPAEIDVNIHPTKTEIKFENEQAIWQILLAAVREALGRFNAIPTIDFDTEGRPTDIPVFNPNTPTPSKLKPPTVPVDSSFNPFDQTPPSTPSHSKRYEGYEFPAPHEKAVPRDWQSLYQTTKNDDLLTPSLEIGGESLSADHFQYRAQYILTPVQSGLMVIDQHRAHIRILNDRFLSQLEQSPLPSQRDLFPEVLHLSPEDAATYTDLQEDFHRFGFDVSDLGGNTISIIGYPSGFEGLEPQRLFLDLLSAGADRGNLSATDLYSRFAITLARAAAIPVGQVLSLLEMQDLVAQLFATKTPNYTPDGQPIIAIIPQENIEKLFK